LGISEVLEPMFMNFDDSIDCLYFVRPLRGFVNREKPDRA